MPARRVRYRMNNSSFGEMMVSDQIRDVAKQAAHDIAAVATETQHISKDPYGVDVEVPPVVIKGNPRAVAHVVGNDRLHAVEEFGSGIKSRGRVRNDGGGRPQGGWSEPQRTLARAAAAVIPAITRDPE